MRDWLGIAIVLATVGAGCGGGAAVGDDSTIGDTGELDENLAGVWSATVDASALPPGAGQLERDAMVGEWTVHLASDGAFQLRRAGTTRAEGRWYTHGSTLFVEQPGASDACRRAGRYSFDPEFDHADVRVQEDDCELRRRVLSSRLTRQ